MITFVVNFFLNILTIQIVYYFFKKLTNLEKNQINLYIMRYFSYFMIIFYTFITIYFFPDNNEILCLSIYNINED